jgi:GGDEF domain-containing protein
VLAAALRRPGDMAARLEEGLFALLLPITDRIGAQRVAERLHEALATGWSDGVAAAPGAFRIGACSVLPLGEDQHQQAILDLAHAALAEAREGGLSVRAAAEPTLTLPVRASVG